MSKNKFVCIHGHFYQPPRENPWLNTVEVQDSAYPFHDWNERISSECYSRNSAARILDGEGRIVDIVNNYSRMSFNFGPTLMQWMKNKDPETYKAILVADKESLKRFSGHGSAIAQSFNHIIMPLANRRDKETQVIWGIKDFEHRFKRKPEGMWLSETAVNTDTLEVMAKYGIKFTILSPYQAKNVRKIGEKEWIDANGAKVDPRCPYLCKLPSGRKINLFFYDGPVSQGIAFEGLLNNGKIFADRLTGQLDMQDETNTPQLMHIATDGETYGHHHRLGEMGLSYCLHHIEHNEEANLTVYGEYLEKFPPEYEAQIIENTAWSSTPHLERWSEDGGGNTGGHPNWHQKWRKPLREAFDWLRDEMIIFFEQEMNTLVRKPWDVRNAYIDVILDRSRENTEKFVKFHAKKPLSHKEQIKFFKLLEIQYHCMLMYTSCGWFFDEVTGIETLQDILYAARAIQLAQDLGEKNYEKEFIRLLKKCPSNIPEYGNAAAAYEKFVKPSIVDMHRVGAHFAISSLFFEYPEKSKVYSFDVDSEHYEFYEAGKYSLAIGKAKLTSEVSWEENLISYSILHLGDHHLFGGVREFNNEASYESMMNEIRDAFEKSRVHEVVVLMDKHFGNHNYSFWHLFKEDQKKILDKVMGHTMKSIESSFSDIYEDNYSLMQAMKELGLTPPTPLKFCSDFTINAKLEEIFKEDDIDYKELNAIVESFKRLEVKVNKVGLDFLAAKKINGLMSRLKNSPEDVLLMSKISKFMEATKKVQLTPDLWQAQNFAFQLRRNNYQHYLEKSEIGDQEATVWIDNFNELFSHLNIKITEGSLMAT
ncbi:alpha-amylase/alpha-mannosidase (GH57 family) [Catalinimonas alkaloidigena]|uniref:DUF3536 domain-containing protein n=1 Tax=Catalinimonas alkaloidigena TaxID=1075417 RepID=UPI002406FC2D|nr:DUF3536 domain-containing protein [Catalinimonas alkaloidigena]MDF9797215.1 alpha-amylase/alpha-mannosidase (GH57 family) [Catalinimonas alkaloidigena]